MCPPLQLKAIGVYVSSNEIGGKWLLRLKFLLIGAVAADWPLCSLSDWNGVSLRVIHWDWHQWTSCLTPPPKGRISCFKTSHFHFEN